MLQGKNLMKKSTRQGSDSQQPSSSSAQQQPIASATNNSQSELFPSSNPTVSDNRPPDPADPSDNTTATDRSSESAQPSQSSTDPPAPPASDHRSAEPARRPSKPTSANRQPEPAEPTTATGPPASEAAPTELDPFDPETYRRVQNQQVASEVSKILVEIPVCNPHKEWWFRVHDNPEYAFIAWMIEVRVGRETELYLVLPHLWPSLQKEPCFKPRTLRLAITRQGKLFIWPVRCQTDANKKPDRWMVAPLEAARQALKQWTRLYWNDTTRQHEVEVSLLAGEPEWPTVPFKDLLKIAFKDRVIADRDHPVLRQLRGEA
jgi:hypothetical protein